MKKPSISKKINHILHPPKPRPIIKNPLVMYYTIDEEHRYVIPLSELDLKDVFDLPLDPVTCEPVEGTYKFFYETLTIPALTKSIRTDIVFIPADLNKYTYIRSTCLIYIKNWDKTYEYKEFSRKRGLWYY